MNYDGCHFLLGICSLRSSALEHSVGSFSFGSLFWGPWHSWLGLLARLAWLAWLALLAGFASAAVGQERSLLPVTHLVTHLVPVTWYKQVTRYLSTWEVSRPTYWGSGKLDAPPGTKLSFVFWQYRNSRLKSQACVKMAMGCVHDNIANAILYKLATAPGLCRARGAGGNGAGQ